MKHEQESILLPCSTAAELEYFTAQYANVCLINSLWLDNIWLAAEECYPALQETGNLLLVVKHHSKTCITRFNFALPNYYEGNYFSHLSLVT